jgi:hypothetical protein
MPIRPSHSAYALVLCYCLLIPRIAMQGQVQPEVAPPAKSDTYGTAADGRKERIQHRELASANFRISGVDLSGEDVLSQAARIFGNSPIKSSGDAGTASHEACYQSGTEGDSTHLIFGRGEVDFWFTLSSAVSEGKGNLACARSGKITRDITTDSGLHLGLTKQQVIAVLGLATNRSQTVRQRTEVLIYSLETEEKTDPQKLEQWWEREIKENPRASRQTFLENYANYTLEVYITAQFTNDSLNQLNISWSGTY